MLRLATLKKLVSNYNKANLYSVFSAKRFFANEKEPEKEEEAKEEDEKVEEEEENDEEWEELKDDEQVQIERVSKVPINDAQRLVYYRKELEWKMRNPNSGPFDFKTNFAKLGDEHLAKLHEISA